MNKAIVFIIIILSPFRMKAQMDSIPRLNPMKYIDIGMGMSIPDGFGGLNAALSLDVNDLLVMFIEYNIFLNSQKIYLHETNMKIGPYVRFNTNTFAALSAGFSFLFNPSAHKESQYDHNDNYLFNIPLQLKYNFGINEWLGLGLKVNYNMVITEQGRDMGSFFVFLTYKLK